MDGVHRPSSVSPKLVHDTRETAWLKPTSNLNISSQVAPLGGWFGKKRIGWLPIPVLQHPDSLLSDPIETNSLSIFEQTGRLLKCVNGKQL
jgi:hypothetical protein